MNYYPRYPGDYLAKTLHLSMVEDGAYTRLLDWYYANEQPIPHARRYAVARATSATERAAVDAVLAEFFTTDADVYRHARVDAEIAEAVPRIAAAKANGKRGGRKPKQNPAGNPVGFPDGTQRESSPTPTPLGNVEEPHTETRVDVGDTKPTQAGLMCRAMKVAGVSDVNPGNPDLLALIDAGASEAEFVGAAQTAAKKGKGFNYALGTLIRQRAEAAEKAKTMHRGPMPGQAVQSREAERTAEYLATQFRPLTAEEKAAADEARKRAMASVRSVA